MLLRQNYLLQLFQCIEEAINKASRRNEVVGQRQGKIFQLYCYIMNIEQYSRRGKNGLIYLTNH
jgi:hypothetical protein